MSETLERNNRDLLEADALDRVVGGTATTEPPPPEDEMMPPPDGSEPPPPPPEGHMPPPPDGHMPPPPPSGEGEEGPMPPPDGGELGAAPPPHPEGYVNGFIEPLYDGLTYNEGGLSTWTLAIDPSAVDMTNDTFIVSADQVGTWEGGIPPEATDNGDGTYTIQCWAIDSLVDNGDGTITLNVEIPPFFGGGEGDGGSGSETGSETGSEGDGGAESMPTMPPHPEDTANINEFIEPLYDGLTYNDSGLSEWVLPIDIADVDTSSNTFVVSAADVGTTAYGIPGEATDNGDGTYTIQSWPIDSVTDNGDGTVTLMVDIGPLPS